LKGPVIRSQRRGAIFVASGAVLGALAGAIALIPAGGPSIAPGVNSYPYAAGAFPVRILTSIIVVSAFFFSLGAIELWTNGLRIVLVLAATMFIVGVVSFLLSIVWAVRIQLSDGNVLYVQPYPQTIYLIVWSVSAFAFYPVARYLDHQLARAAQPAVSGSKLVG
jgi:hypothetical protein